MGILDIFNNLEIVQTLAPAINDDDDTEVVAGAVVDNEGSLGHVVHVVNVGASGDTLSGSVKISLILQHGDLANGSDMAAVADANHQIGTFETAASGILKILDAPGDASKRYVCGYRGPKRYSRMVGLHNGTHTNGTAYGMVAVKGPLRSIGALSI